MPNDNNIPSINTVKSTTSINAQRRKQNDSESTNSQNRPITANLISPEFDQISNNHNSSQHNKLLLHNQQNQINMNFPSLSLAISPTVSHDRIEKVRTSTNSNSTDINTTSSKNISTIKEQDSNKSNTESKDVPNVSSLSLLSPDLNDVIAAPKPQQIKFRSSINASDSENITNPINAFQQFEDYVVYDGIKLFDDDIEVFLNEKEKLEDKLNDAMASYQSNNVQYLNNIVEQYRTQKLRIIQDINDQQTQNQALKKLQHDLEILDESLKRQFEESKKTLYNQLTAIHHKRLKEFAVKLHEKSSDNSRKNEENKENVAIKSPPIQLQTSLNINNQNINIPQQKENVAEKEIQSGVKTPEDRDELNMTLREVSNLLEKCWKNELEKQQRSDKQQQKEIKTLKEILRVYENLSKLIQVQSNKMRETIEDYQHLNDEQREQMMQQQQQQNQQQMIVQDESYGSTEITSPDKTKIYLAQLPSGQIQLVSSADIPNNFYIQQPQQQVQTSEEYNIVQPQPHVGGAMKSSGRKKRRKSLSKKSTKNSSSKTPAFSFEYNRQTVSSQNKKVNSKRKGKKTKKSS